VLLLCLRDVGFRKPIGVISCRVFLSVCVCLSGRAGRKTGRFANGRDVLALGE
jgi:hypothetical protein